MHERFHALHSFNFAQSPPTAHSPQPPTHPLLIYSSMITHSHSQQPAPQTVSRSYQTKHSVTVKQSVTHSPTVPPSHLSPTPTPTPTHSLGLTNPNGGRTDERRRPRTWSECLQVPVKANVIDRSINRRGLWSRVRLALTLTLALALTLTC